MKSLFLQSARVALIALVACAVIHFGDRARKALLHWSFASYVIDYSHKVERTTAYTVYDLAKPYMSLAEKEGYEKRLAVLDEKFQHPLREAVHNATDSEFMTRKTDSFDKLLTDIRFEVRGSDGFDAKVKECVEKLCSTQGEVACVAWPFICEDLGLYHGGEAMPYEEVLRWKAELKQLEYKMAGLLASK